MPVGECLLATFNCLATIEKNSLNYQYFRYINNAGVEVYFEDGDTLLINDIANNRLEVFDYVAAPQSYQQQPLLVAETATDLNLNKYYFAPSFETDNVVKTFIQDLTIGVNEATVTGETFENVLVEIWVKFIVNGVLVEEQRAYGMESELSGAGITFSYDSVNDIAVQLRVSNAKCSLFDKSEWGIFRPPVNPMQGINYMQIGFDFKVS